MGSREAYCDMKIKEKGLTGKTAEMRKDSIASRKGFNAFQEMQDEKKGKGQKGKDRPNPEVWLEFMGTKIRVQEEDGGSVKNENVPYIKGATMKFTGCGGDANFTEMKVIYNFRSVCLGSDSWVPIDSSERTLCPGTIHPIFKRG